MDHGVWWTRCSALFKNSLPGAGLLLLSSREYRKDTSLIHLLAYFQEGCDCVRANTHGEFDITGAVWTC